MAAALDWLSERIAARRARQHSLKWCSRMATLAPTAFERELVRSGFDCNASPDTNDPVSARLDAALQRLSDEERVLLALWRTAPYRRVATILGISDEEAFRRITRLISALAEEISPVHSNEEQITEPDSSNLKVLGKPVDRDTGALPAP